MHCYNISNRFQLAKILYFIRRTVASYKLKIFKFDFNSLVLFLLWFEMVIFLKQYVNMIIFQLSYNLDKSFSQKSFFGSLSLLSSLSDNLLVHFCLFSVTPFKQQVKCFRELSDSSGGLFV